MRKMHFINVKRRAKSGLLAVLFGATQILFPLLASNTAYAASADIDQWANLDSAWINGNLNETKATLTEGDSVPFRSSLTGLSNGTHKLRISYDNVSNGKHAYDFLTSYDRTFAPNACVSVIASCVQGTAGSIPTDTTLANPPGPVSQVPGQIKIFGATGTSTAVTGVAYISAPGHVLGGGDKTTVVEITFTTNTPTVVLAWGGHIAKESDWGINNGASAISGSPYHMRLQSLDGASTGNQDRSMKASAVVLLPRITITKIVQGGSANPWDFTFNVSPAIAGHPNPITIPSGQNSVTLFDVQPNGSYAITENGVPGYNFVTGTGTNCSFNGSTATATVASGTAGNLVNASCTFTNGLIPSSITLIKDVVNNNGGTAGPNDFGLSIGGTSVTSGQKLPLMPGSYAINEAGLPGYGFVSITGTGCPTTLGGNVNLASGQNIVCTIKNDDIAPTLKLVKTVVNNNGGSATTADFQGKIDSNNVSWNVAVPVSAGAHSASEAAILPGGAGYTAGNWGGDCAANGSVSLALGENKVCTITNDDQPPVLILNKIVSNTHGGTATESAWTLTANGPSTLSGQGASGTNDVVSSPSFKAGTYTLSESGGPNGYSASSWSCTNDVTVSGNQITIKNGQTTVCTITNSDIAPILTVIKQVLNPYGNPLPASSFPLFVNGQSVTSGEANQFNAGGYTITETQQPGYTFTGVSGDCSIVEGVIRVLLSLGDNATCTLTNTAIQPKLIVKKVVINDNSGTKSPEDFTMTVSGNSQTVPNFPGAEAGTEIGLNEGSYSADELSHDGYTKTLSADCNGTISVGQVKTCTITNNDIAHPAIHIEKNGPATAHEGDAVTYTFDVTNVGDTKTLSGVTVTDTIGNEQSNAVYQSGDTNSNGLLEKGEVWHYTLVYIIPAGTNSVFNTAEACGFDPDQTKVCDEDTHTLVVLHPALQVVKSGPATANPGDTVTYTFTVTNEGDTPLDITKVEDSIAGAGTYKQGDTNNNGLLDVTETWIYTANYTIPVDQDGNVLNTVTVCGKDSLGGKDCDTDTHTLVVLAKVIVTKYNDYNRNGMRDEGEPLLPNWEFNLTDGRCDDELELGRFLAQAIDNEGACYDKTQTTESNGSTTFTGVYPDRTYQLWETIPENSNWHLSNIDCDTEGGRDGDIYYFGAGSGQTVHCLVGNYRDAVLDITKSNNRPYVTVTGDTVTYTLTVSVPQESGKVFGTTVTDLPPEGFKYLHGSWTAFSSVRGNIKGVVTTEPTYGSPGVWMLGDMIPGEVVTLTYQTLIESSVSDGTYPDIAFADGCSTPVSGEVTCDEEGAVYANVRRQSDDAFVGTTVTVASAPLKPAAITKLVNTGATTWFNTLVAITLAGAALITLVRREQKGAK